MQRVWLRGQTAPSCSGGHAGLSMGLLDQGPPLLAGEGTMHRLDPMKVKHTSICDQHSFLYV